jgi:hypothetical protein
MYTSPPSARTTAMAPAIHQILLLLRDEGGAIVRLPLEAPDPRENPARYSVDELVWLRVTVRRRLAIGTLNH